MAPPKAARKKNIQNGSAPQDLEFAMGAPSIKEDHPGEPALVSQPADVYARAQEDEREVLRAIFMEDFEEIEAKGAWSVSIILRTTINHKA